MDENTKAKYKTWVRRRIIKRIVVPSVLLLVVVFGLIFGLRSWGNGDDDDEIVTEIYEETNDDSEYVEEDEEDDSLTMSVINQPTYEDFDFSTYNEDAIVEHDATYLDSYLILVNKVFSLPEDYSPSDLVLPEVFSAWGHDNTNHRMREVAASALEDMFASAYEDEGLILWIASGYRSFEEQAYKHQYFIDTHGSVEAEKMSARPGHSEHQTGLVVDVTSASVGALLTEDFANELEGRWLQENAHQFGFIIRYPSEKMALTGVEYEPWHIRYVGISEATYIFENDIVLEQYIFPLPQWEQP